MRVRWSAEGILTSAMRTSFQQNRALRMPTASSGGRLHTHATPAAKAK